MLRLFLKFIDKTSEVAGSLFAWLIVGLVAGLMYEVIARYVFNAPTIWAYDLTYMIYGAHFMMGAAYLLYVRGYVRIDVFYRFLSPRWKGGIDAFLFLVLFFPVMVVLLVKGIDYAAFSWSLKETSTAGAWSPPIYPLKTVLPVAIFLLMLQGVAEFIRSLGMAVRGKEYGA